MQKNRYAFQFVLLFFVILLFQTSAGALDEKSATEEVELPDGGGDPGKAYLNTFQQVFFVLVNDKDPRDLPNRNDTKAIFFDMRKATCCSMSLPASPDHFPNRCPPAHLPDCWK